MIKKSLFIIIKLNKNKLAREGVLLWKTKKADG